MTYHFALSTDNMTKKTDKIKDLEEKVNQLEAQLKRAVADYQNLEKRVTEGRSELTAFVGGELIKRLLPVLDHLEMSVEGGRQVLSEQSESKEWVKGVELAIKEFKQVLAQEGLEEIEADPSTSSGQGVQFDPSLHEAVDTREGDDNIILEVVRKGYRLNNRVVRPAQVVVGRREPSNMNQELREENPA